MLSVMLHGFIPCQLETGLVSLLLLGLGGISESLILNYWIMKAYVNDWMKGR